MNRKSILWTAVACAALALSACATQPPPPAVTVTDSAPPSQEDLFWTLMSNHPRASATEGTRSSSVELAKSVCEALDAGLPYAIIVAEIPDSDYADTQRFILAAGVTAFCPQFIEQIR